MPYGQMEKKSVSNGKIYLRFKSLLEVKLQKQHKTTFLDPLLQEISFRHLPDNSPFIMASYSLNLRDRAGLSIFPRDPCHWPQNQEWIYNTEKTFGEAVSGKGVQACINRVIVGAMATQSNMQARTANKNLYKRNRSTGRTMESM